MDAKAVARGILEGIESLPKGIGYSVRRTWQGAGLGGGQFKRRNELETERFIKVIRAGYGIEAPLRELITVIIRDCYHRMDAETQTALGRKLNLAEGYVAGRMGTQFILVQQITHHILKKAIGSTLFKWVFKGITVAGLNIILLQGIIEQAAVSSRRLREKYPSTYHKLTPRNLDMIYFLAEEYLEPFVAYSSKSKMFCEGVNNELSKVLGQ
ncbi:hypothetical protein [Serratia proteamaculans]|uniref:hypothetical protein n=1 Tax=Serratia proteamaculans TaxID=28151 RepID=UPI002178510F|nr:hypothetical protein [Serratia proteamaculans]CAI0888819.1 Uncharacterised protein [Serratia proteamaculans]CAI1057742.1 Uncharacterised protein [Serratia proteamaculans]